MQTINNHNADLRPVFQFATDATGNITHWDVVVATASFGPRHIDTFNTPDISDDDRASIAGTRTSAGNIDSPGVWSVNASVPDAGSTLSLMTLTLMALGLVARRFQRAAG